MKQSCRLGTTYVLGVTSSSTPTATAFASQTQQIRVVSNSHCIINIGASPTVISTTGVFVPGLREQFFTVTPGQKIAVLQAPTDGLVASTVGVLYVTEIA